MLFNKTERKNLFMQKKIRLLLTIAMLCSALVGCYNNVFSIISDSLFHIEGTTLTPINIPDGDSIYITHGEGFTDVDLDFISFLHGQKRNDSECDWVMPTDGRFEELFNMIKTGYQCLLVKIESPYIICAYLRPGALPYIRDRFGNYSFDATKYVWYKFSESSEMLEKMNGLSLTEEIYLLSDCTVEKDIVNEINYNKSIKIYMRAHDKNPFSHISSNMLLYTGSSSEIVESSRFIHINNSNFNPVFKLYIDSDSKKYLCFDINSSDGIYNFNDAEKLFGSYYVAFEPYFKVLIEKGQAYTIGIELNTLLNILRN